MVKLDKFALFSPIRPGNWLVVDTQTSGLFMRPKVSLGPPASRAGRAAGSIQPACKKNESVFRHTLGKQVFVDLEVAGTR